MIGHLTRLPGAIDITAMTRASTFPNLDHIAAIRCHAPRHRRRHLLRVAPDTRWTNPHAGVGRSHYDPSPFQLPRTVQSVQAHVREGSDLRQDALGSLTVMQYVCLRRVPWTRCEIWLSTRGECGDGQDQHVSYPQRVLQPSKSVPCDIVPRKQESYISPHHSGVRLTVAKLTP